MATLNDFLKSIADAIRSKKGSIELINAKNFANEILSIESGTSIEDATVVAGDILSGKIAYGSSGRIVGSMTNNGGVSSNLNAGQSYTIPAGYHNGSGKINANTLALQTTATAIASDIANGKTAWVNGNKITGSGSMSAKSQLSIVNRSSFIVTVNYIDFDTQSIVSEKLNADGKTTIFTFVNSIVIAEPSGIGAGKIYDDGSTVTEWIRIEDESLAFFIGPTDDAGTIYFSE